MALTLNKNYTPTNRALMERFMQIFHSRITKHLFPANSIYNDTQEKYRSQKTGFMSQHLLVMKTIISVQLHNIFITVMQMFDTHSMKNTE